MLKAAPFFKILRLNNALMTAIAVLLGFWLTKHPAAAWKSGLLALAGIFIVGFGNIVNDIRDIDTDKMCHPERPLAKGEISAVAATIWGLFLLICGVCAALWVSPTHAVAGLVPAILLTLYALAFKGTPLLGNVVVSILVAYSLLFGGIGSGSLHVLFVPALLAFLLNLSREIIKDIQDEEGDKAAGLVTTAALPEALLKALVVTCAITYGMGITLPYFFGHFGLVYLAICIAILVPVHVSWLTRLFRPSWKGSLARVSSLIKWEMLGGLIALALDHAVRVFTPLQ